MYNYKKKINDSLILFIIIYMVAMIYSYIRFKSQIFELQNVADWTTFKPFVMNVIVYPFLFVCIILPLYPMFVIEELVYMIRINKMRKIKIENEDIYYREILKEYSPAEISYINDYNTEIKKDIVATLLDLKLKGKIDFQNNKIVLLDDSEGIGLKKNQQYILSKIKAGKNIFDNIGKFKAFIEEDLCDAKLIEKKEYRTEKQVRAITEMVIILAVTVFVYFFIGAINPKIIQTQNAEKITNILIGLALYIPFFITSYVCYTGKKNNLRTKKGNELYGKIIRLKNFLKDYSELHNKEIAHIDLWDEYFIYSVLFEQNKIVYKELEKVEGLENMEKVDEKFWS